MEMLFDRCIEPQPLDDDGLEELRLLNKELRQIQYEMINGLPKVEYKAASLGERK